MLRRNFIHDVPMAITVESITLPTVAEANRNLLLKRATLLREK